MRTSSEACRPRIARSREPICQRGLSNIRASAEFAVGSEMALK